MSLLDKLITDGADISALQAQLDALQLNHTSDVATLQAAIDALSGGGASWLGSPFMLPPSDVDGAYSDEFADGDPALEARGWTVVDHFTGATLTRLGDVPDILGSPSLGSGYYSTLTPGGLVLRSANYLSISKAPSDISGVFSACLWASTTVGVAASQLGYSPTVIDGTPRLYIGEVSGKHNYTYYQGSYTVYRDVTLERTAQPMVHVQRWENTTQSAQAKSLTPQGRVYYETQNSLPAFAPARAGVLVYTGNAPLATVKLRFLRRQPYATALFPY